MNSNTTRFHIKHFRVAEIICGLILLGFILVSLFALLGLFSSSAANIQLNNIYSPPSMDHWFGTDALGRDVLHRTLQGAHVAFMVGLFSALLSVSIGVSLGSLAGYFGGFIDDWISWVYTTIESIPGILLITALAFAFGPGVENICLVLGLTTWVKLCRLVRTEFFRQRNQDYVLAAKALGVQPYKRIFKHIMPNVIHIGFIQFTLIFILAIKYEVILTYLGLGVEPGHSSWGIMLSDAKADISKGVWWGFLSVSTPMFLLIFSLYTLTESVKVRLDPKKNSFNI